MVGNCAIYDFDINLYNGMNLLQIRPSDDVCKKWLLYFLKSYYFNQSVKAIAKHAINQVSVPVNRLKEVRIFEPSIDEQYSIANFLDQKTAEIDGLIADKEKLIELLQEKRQAVITEAVTKGLNPNVRMKDSGIEWIGEIPEHWEVASFTKYISSIVDYRGKTPEKVDEGVFLVTAKNIKNGRIDYSLSQEYVKTEEYAQIMRRGLPEIGDVLFTTEAPLGEVANVDRTDIALAQRVIKFRGKEMQLDNYYLKYWIMSHGFQHDLQSYATGSTATGIKASKLSKLIILLPIFEEQKAIAYFLDKKTSEIDELISNIRVQIEKLKEYRQSLISEAVTGKIDVRDYANN
jgi:type I restriction enzyme S subunit